MKTQRIWVYGLCEFDWKIVAIQKKRGPFTGKLDLPGWKIEHWEEHKIALKRELEEELWVLENDIEIEKLLCVEEDFVKHIWEWKEKDEHIIAIIYKVKIHKLNLGYIEKWWDSEKIFLIDTNDTTFEKINIFKKILRKKF